MDKRKPHELTDSEILALREEAEKLRAERIEKDHRIWLYTLIRRVFLWIAGAIAVAASGIEGLHKIVQWLQPK